MSCISVYFLTGEVVLYTMYLMAQLSEWLCGAKTDQILSDV